MNVRSTPVRSKLLHGVDHLVLGIIIFTAGILFERLHRYHHAHQPDRLDVLRHPAARRHGMRLVTSSYPLESDGI